MMEIVSRESIKVPHSVIISGLTATEADNEVSSFLEKYGSIKRFLRIDDPPSEYHAQMIVEFTHGTAMQTLEPMLPVRLESSTRAEAVYNIRSLASEYATDARSTATKAYMKELKEIAELSGNSFEQLLKEELASLATTSSPPDHQAPVTNLLLADQLSQAAPLVGVIPHGADLSYTEPQREAALPHDSLTLNKNLTDLTSLPTLPVEGEKPKVTLEVNPPSVQRVVVEHVVRNADSSLHSTVSGRLRAFSGRSPRPSNEADYDTWRTSVDIILNDPSVSDICCTHRILDSLFPPAAEIVKHLGSQAQPSAYLALLDSAYGTVEDGDELFARFMNTLQNTGEKPSVFLHRLHVCLSMAMRRKGVSASDFDRQLLKQFCRGCWDDVLITNLQLEQKKESPPTFAELLLLLRTVEDRQATKVNRMRQHLDVAKSVPCNTKPRIASHVQNAHAHATDSDLDILKKQLADISAQLSNLKTDTAKPNVVESPVASATVRAKAVTREAAKTRTFAAKTHGRPRPGFCFQCGEDGHIMSVCENEPNPTLVATKRKQLREKQASWDSSNAHKKGQPLN